MIKDPKRSEAIKEFTIIINKYSLENESNTPDFILAEYLMKCLEAHAALQVQRGIWYVSGKSL